jgi:hypothetical protein
MVRFLSQVEMPNQIAKRIVAICKISLFISGVASLTFFSFEVSAQSAGSLVPGAIVKVPSSIASKHAVERDVTETALMDWLGNRGELKSYMALDGDKKRDFFFPVEVVDPKGSKGITPGMIIYAPIRYLTRSQGLTMIIEADPQMQPDPRDPMSKPVVAFLPAVQKQLDKVDRRVAGNIVNRRDPSSTARNYKSTCAGSFEDFKKEIVQVGQLQKIPVEILTSIMHIETAGRCSGIHTPVSRGPNVGLFQVNTNSTPVARCNPWQMTALKNVKTVTQLHNGALKCLDNPVVNLAEAAQILRAKYAHVNTQKQPEPGRWDQVTPKAHDEWRKAIAAYNGGQGYVYQSYFDIVAYNEKNGTQLDPDSWEVRRVFFFRKVLDRKTDQLYFANAQKFRRGLGQILINIAYVESISGRESKPDESSYAMVMQWVRDLYQRAKTPPVPSAQPVQIPLG